MLQLIPAAEFESRNPLPFVCLVSQRLSTCRALSGDSYSQVKSFRHKLLARSEVPVFFAQLGQPQGRVSRWKGLHDGPS